LATTAFVATSFAPLASPALIGTPTAPTPATANSSTALATTAFVKAQGYWVAAADWSFDASHNLHGTHNVTGSPVTIVPGIQLTGADGVVEGLNLSAFGDSAYPALCMTGAGNTMASPAALANNATYAAWVARGYNGSAYGNYNTFAIYVQTAEAWTTTANGTTVLMMTPPPGTTTPVVQMTLGNGVAVGAPTGGVRGIGTINATAVYANGTTLTSDILLKRDLAPLPEDCVALVAAITPQRFRHLPPLPAMDAMGGPVMVQGPPGFYERTNWGVYRPGYRRGYARGRL
jgi:hypothetical protein